MGEGVFSLALTMVGPLPAPPTPSSAYHMSKFLFDFPLIGKVERWLVWVPALNVIPVEKLTWSVPRSIVA